jgi:hypothetical protein
MSVAGTSIRRGTPAFSNRYWVEHGHGVSRGGHRTGTVRARGRLCRAPPPAALLRPVPEERVDDVSSPRPIGVIQRLRRADGSEVQVESFGPEGAPPLFSRTVGGDNRGSGSTCGATSRIPATD